MRHLLGVVAIGVTLATLNGAASAATTIAPGSDDSRPYLRWIERSHAETPEVELQVIAGPCPYAVARGCTRSDLMTIWIDEPWRDGGKRVFFHELGHRYDYLMSAEVRAGFQAAMGDDQWQSETFAETYQQCAMGGWRHVRWGFDEATPIPRRAMVIVCRLLRRDEVARGDVELG